MAFGEHIRGIRKKNNMTLESLAFNADMEISQIYRIEKGINNPTLSTLKSLANALDLTIPELLTF